MDKALYVAMTGARASLQAQGTLSHNLANSDTPGFKEALANTEAFPIRGPGFASRVDALHVDAGFNRTAGAQHITGKPLDLSLQTGSWLAVQLLALRAPPASGSVTDRSSFRLSLSPFFVLSPSRSLTSATPSRRSVLPVAATSLRIWSVLTT